MEKKDIKEYTKLIEASFGDVFPYAFILAKDREKSLKMLICTYCIAWEQSDSFDEMIDFKRYVKTVLIRAVLCNQVGKTAGDQSDLYTVNENIRGPDEEDDTMIKRLITMAVSSVGIGDNELVYVKDQVLNIISNVFFDNTTDC